MLIEGKTLQIYSFKIEARGIPHSKDRRYSNHTWLLCLQVYFVSSLAKKDTDFQEELQTNTVTLSMLVALDSAEKPEQHIPTQTKNPKQTNIKFYLHKRELPSKRARTQNGKGKKLCEKLHYIARYPARAKNT